MKAVWSILTVCGILIVAAALAVQFMPTDTQRFRIKETKYSIDAGNADYASIYTNESDDTDSDDVYDKNADESHDNGDNNDNEYNNAENKNDDRNDNDDGKEFFVADAPYRLVQTVEFTTLININNRLDADFEPDDLVYVRDYVDQNMITLNSQYTQADKTALLAFIDMIEAAEAEGVTDFYLRNVYRSYDMQQALWNKRLKEDKEYGCRKGVPLGSAYPGASEHQTGLAFDIMCTSSPEATDKFKNTENYKWLRKNAHKFGFIMRYSASKTTITGIKFEPYHYRYVGVELAKELYESGLSLEEYYNKPVQWKWNE